jgi:hypothetical protein
MRHEKEEEEMWTFSSSFLCTTNCRGGEFEAASTMAVAFPKSRFCHRKCRGRFCHRIAAELSSDGWTHRCSELIYMILFLSFVLLMKGNNIFVLVIVLHNLNVNL